jgi:hypothetical protein
MTEPIAGAALSTVGNDAQGVLTRLLGPTADVMGSQLASWYKSKNVERVVRQAEKKAKTERDGSIPPRVAQEVFEKAQWSENEFVAEYLSGVLASSRTLDGQNDSGVAWTALVGRLSSDQLALHWVIYTSAQKRSRESEYETVWILTREQIIIELEFLLQALAWSPSNPHNITRLYEAAYGLLREGLVEALSHGRGSYLQDEVTYTRGKRYDANRDYVTFRLTVDGIGLLIQSLGLSGQWFGAYLEEEVSDLIDRSDELPSVQKASFVRDFPPVDNS